jgi:hypothetical protein
MRKPQLPMNREKQIAKDRESWQTLLPKMRYLRVGARPEAVLLHDCGGVGGEDESAGELSGNCGLERASMAC